MLRDLFRRRRAGRPAAAVQAAVAHRRVGAADYRQLSQPFCGQESRNRLLALLDQEARQGRPGPGAPAAGKTSAPCATGPDAAAG